MQILTKCPSHYASVGHGRMQLGTGRVSPLQQPRTASHWYVFESGSGAAGFGLCGLPAAADMHTSQRLSEQRSWATLAGGTRAAPSV